MSESRDQPSRKQQPRGPGERLLDLSLQKRDLPVERAQQELRSAPENSWRKWAVRVGIGIVLLMLIVLARGCYQAEQSAENFQHRVPHCLT